MNLNDFSFKALELLVQWLIAGIAVFTEWGIKLVAPVVPAIACSRVQTIGRQQATLPLPKDATCWHVVHTMTV